MMAKQNSVEAMERRRVKNPVKMRKHTSIACIHCWKSKTGCNVSRPCSRCKRLGYEDCYDRPTQTKTKQNVKRKQKITKITKPSPKKQKKNKKRKRIKRISKKDRIQKDVEPPPKKRKFHQNHICLHQYNTKSESISTSLNSTISPISPIEMSSDMFSTLNYKFSLHSPSNDEKKKTFLNNDITNKLNSCDSDNEFFNNIKFKESPCIKAMFHNNNNIYECCNNIQYDTDYDEQFQINLLITSSHQMDNDLNMECSIIDEDSNDYNEFKHSQNIQITTNQSPIITANNKNVYKRHKSQIQQNNSSNKEISVLSLISNHDNKNDNHNKSLSINIPPPMKYLYEFTEVLQPIPVPPVPTVTPLSNIYSTKS